MTKASYHQEADFASSWLHHRMLSQVGADGFLAFAALCAQGANDVTNRIHATQVRAILAHAGVLNIEKHDDIIQALMACRLVRGEGEWLIIPGLEIRPAVEEQTDDGPREGHVYFVQAGGSSGDIKIGFASDVRARISTLQTGSAAPLELLATIPGTMATERAFHERFRHLRTRGEWFHPAGELVSFIASFRSQP